MFSFLKNLDDKLIKNKPHIWLTQIHVYLPVTLGLILVFCMVAFWLPLTANVYWILIASLVNCLLFLAHIAYRQRLFFNKLFSPGQLHSIYRLNMLLLVLLTLAVVLTAGILSARVKTGLEKYPFETAEQTIRIGMIRSDVIQLIKDGMLDRSVRDSVLPSLQKTLPDSSYNKLLNSLDELDHNKFVHNDFSQLNIYSSTEDRADSVFATDTSTLQADTSLVHTQPDSAKPVAEAAKPPYEYSLFLQRLRNLPDSAIHSIKQEANTIIDYFSFSRYSGEDSSAYFGTMNEYFETLKKQTLTLDAAVDFSGRYFVYLYCIILLPVLANFMFVIVMKHHFVTACLSLMVYGGLLFIFLSETLPQTVTLSLLCIVVLLTIFFSKILWKPYTYSQLQLFFLYLLNSIASGLLAFLILFVYFTVLNAPEVNFGRLDESAGLVLVFFIVLFGVLQVVNIPFMRRYNRVNNLAKE